MTELAELKKKKFKQDLSEYKEEDVKQALRKGATLISYAEYKTTENEIAEKYFKNLNRRNSFSMIVTTEEPPKKKSFKDQYVAFLIAFGVIGIAIGFVIGQAVNKLVTAFVKDIIDPAIGIFLPGNLGNMTATVIGLQGEPVDFKYGDLISNILDFAIIILLVFLAYKLLSRYKLVEDKTEPAAGEK